MPHYFLIFILYCLLLEENWSSVDFAAAALFDLS